MTTTTGVRKGSGPQAYPQGSGGVRKPSRTPADQRKHRKQAGVRTQTHRTPPKPHVSAGQKGSGNVPYYVGGAWPPHAHTPDEPVGPHATTTRSTT